MPLNIGMNQQSPVEFESWFAAIVSGMLSAWQQVIILILLLMVLILFCHYRTQHHQAAAHIEQLSRDLMRRDAQVRILTGHFNGLLARRELDNSNLQRSLDRDFARKSSELANKDQMIAAHYSAVKDCFKAQLSVSSSMDVQEWLQASVAKVGEISVDAADFLRAAFHTIDAETSNRLNIANEKLTRRDNSIRELRSQFNDVYAKLEQTSSSLQMSARDHQEAEKVHWRQVHELNEKISQEAQSRREWILKAKQADNQRDKAERAFRDLHAQQDLDTEKREAELQELQEEIKLLRSSVCEIEHQRHSPVAREVKSRTQSLETENLGLAHGLGKSRYLEGQTAHEGPGSSTGSAFRIAQGNGKHPRQRQAQEESHDSDKVTGSVSLGNGQVRAESTKASYGRQGVEEPRVDENGLYHPHQRHFFFSDRSNEPVQRNESSLAPSDLYQKYKNLCRNSIVDQLACPSPVQQLAPPPDAESRQHVTGEFNSGQINQILAVNDVTLREQSAVQSHLPEDLAAPSSPPPTMTPCSTSTAVSFKAKDCHASQQTDLSLLAQGQSHQLDIAVASPVQQFEVHATELETLGKFIQKPLQIEPMPMSSLQRCGPPAIGVESSAMDLDEPEQQPASEPNLELTVVPSEYQGTPMEVDQPSEHSNSKAEQQCQKFGPPSGGPASFSLMGRVAAAPFPSSSSNTLTEVGEEMMLERSVSVDRSKLEDVLNTPLPPDDDEQLPASDAREVGVFKQAGDRQPGPSRLREVETVDALSEGRKPKRSGPVSFTIG